MLPAGTLSLFPLPIRIKPDDENEDDPEVIDIDPLLSVNESNVENNASDPPPIVIIPSIEDDTECPFDINFDLKEGHEVIFNNTADVVLTLGEDEVELEELGWVKKSEIKMK